jgi:hypothetical protein
VTVRDWIVGQQPRPPRVLTEQVLAALGPDADAPESETGERCLAAAARALEGLLADSRFGRESALQLLVVDALTTYAFEHASAGNASRDSLRQFAERGTHLLARLSLQGV